MSEYADSYGAQEDEEYAKHTQEDHHGECQYHTANLDALAEVIWCGLLDETEPPRSYHHHCRPPRVVSAAIHLATVSLELETGEDDTWRQVESLDPVCLLR